MQVRADLRPGSIPHLAHHLGRPRILGDMIGREVGWPHAQAFEEARVLPQLSDILDRHVGPAAVPVVFLCIEGDDEQ